MDPAPPRRADLRPPAALTIAITGRCNQRCGHCWIEAGVRGSPGPVPPEAVLRVVDGIAALGAEEVWITGGEPLSHPDWAAILLECCARPSLRTVGLQTNAVLVDGAVAARLAALPREKLVVQVSLDGGTARTHDLVRGKGAFAAALEGMSCLVAAGLGARTQIAFTEMRHNMADVPALLELAARLRLRRVVGGTLVKAGRAARHAGGPGAVPAPVDLAAPTPAQYLALLARYREDAAFRARYERYGNFPAIEWWKGRAAERGDPCPLLSHPYVSAAGTLHPCTRCLSGAFATEGAFDGPLSGALERAAATARELVAVARSRPGRLAECAGCPAERACAGGCMGRALATRGTLLAVEDRCTLRRAVAGAERPAPERPSPRPRRRRRRGAPGARPR